MRPVTKSSDPKAYQRHIDFLTTAAFQAAAGDEVALDGFTTVCKKRGVSDEGMVTMLGAARIILDELRKSQGLDAEHHSALQPREEGTQRFRRSLVAYRLAVLERGRSRRRRRAVGARYHGRSNRSRGRRPAPEPTGRLNPATASPTDSIAHRRTFSRPI